MTDPIRFISTRNNAKVVSFRDVALRGLAPDGGLYIPQTWPRISEEQWAEWQPLPYRLLAFNFLRLFTGSDIADDDLARLIKNAYANFETDEVVKFIDLPGDVHLMELFHGPTLAFKDIALQFLGQLFSLLLGQQNERAIVLGATSGDTGPAAIAACAALPNIHTVILYPHNGPSEIQRRQMTTTGASNVHALAVEGSFDDAQKIVKQLLSETAPHGAGWLTINSINLVRILAQSVYYAYAALRYGGRAMAQPQKSVSFVVPTGNFGNIYAGYILNKMGLPMAKMAAATNTNDAVARFINTGMMRAEAVQGSLSPSMDIQRPSNLERLLWELVEGDTSKDSDALNKMLSAPDINITPWQLGKLRQYFTATRVDDDETLATIRHYDDAHHVLIDPHTAVGLTAARKLAHELPTPVISLACASPSKFSATMVRALGRTPPLHPAMRELLMKPEKQTVLPASVQAVREYINKNL